MLKYIITDVNGKQTTFYKPFSMNIVSSLDAPADSMKASFFVQGNIPVIYSVKVYSKSKILFYGFVDEQTERMIKNGYILEIKARSMASLLLDNEAQPLTYCLPTIDMLFERHFKTLGFKGYIGSADALNGNLTITKGMSEWDVLENFCRLKNGSHPFVTNDGYINTGETKSENVIFLSGRMSISRIFKRSVIISDIYSRINPNGDYSMHTVNPEAVSNGIIRKRCFNMADRNRKCSMMPEEITALSNRKAKSYIIGFENIADCGRGDRIVVSKIDEKLIIKEIHFITDSKGEKTAIYAEVDE